jgi:hypothetical protein
MPHYAQLSPAAKVITQALLCTVKYLDIKIRNFAAPSFIFDGFGSY